MQKKDSHPWTYYIILVVILAIIVTAIFTPKIRKFILEKIGAIQGAFYAVNDENPSKPVIEIRASYAYNRKKYLKASTVPVFSLPEANAVIIIPAKGRTCIL